MKKVLGICLVMGLVGCASPTADMTNNNFATIIPSNSDLKGLWTGNNGPYLVTYRFNGDGTGLVCSTYNDKNTLEKIKISNGVIYMQNGLKQTITSNTSDELALKVDYFGGTTYKYKPDENLKNASPYCEKNL